MSQQKRNSLGQIQKDMVGDITGTFHTYLRRKARERGLTWNLSKEFLWELYQKQNGQCALTGQPLVVSTVITKNNLNRTNHTASLDRIDNSIGYEEGNVQWVHKQINRIRRELSVEEFKFWCHFVTDHANPEPSSVNEINVTEKVQRLDGEDSTNNPSTSAQHPFHYCDWRKPCPICKG